jgi:hypothetical protein
MILWWTFACRITQHRLWIPWTVPNRSTSGKEHISFMNLFPNNAVGWSSVIISTICMYSIGCLFGISSKNLNLISLLSLGSELCYLCSFHHQSANILLKMRKFHVEKPNPAPSAEQLMTFMAFTTRRIIVLLTIQIVSSSYTQVKSDVTFCTAGGQSQYHTDWPT